MGGQNIAFHLRIWVNYTFVLSPKSSDASKLRGCNFDFAQEIFLAGKEILGRSARIDAFVIGNRTLLNEINLWVFLLEHHGLRLFHIKLYEISGPINVLGWRLTDLRITINGEAAYVADLFPVIGPWKNLLNFFNFFLFLLDQLLTLSFGKVWLWSKCLKLWQFLLLLLDYFLNHCLVRLLEW